MTNTKSPMSLFLFNYTIHNFFFCVSKELIVGSLFQFFVLLPPLYELILEIERDGISGGRLLNLLHKRCHCGVPELQTCIQRYGLFTQFFSASI